MLGNGLKDKVLLPNGHRIPCIGYGTYKLPDDETAENCVKAAIEIGYRHIDEAAYYFNEKSVGKGIRDSGVKREELFITSKVWTNNRGYDKTMASFDQSMKDLGLDYLDLFLIHWPADAHEHDDWAEINLDTWKALTELYKEGRVKAIGVSNFWPEHLEALMEAEIRPMVNQIEFHPGYRQPRVFDYCRENGILLEAWSPLGRAKVLGHETIVKLAEKYGRSPAQICLRWVMQKDVIPLVKSLNRPRIEENARVFDFAIEDEDMELIDNMEEAGFSGHTPTNVTF